MSGLNLIRDYSSDSDEEYEETIKENEDLNTNTCKKVKLPLPQSIVMLKGVTHHEEVVDDPSEHSGRVRSFKHERGNWATLVYIDYVPCEDMLLWLQKAIVQVVGTGNLFEEFHISLTRTLVLKYHWIDSFVEAVRNIVAGHECFTLELGGIKIYCNEEKTRTFLGITVQTLSNSLQSLTHSLDDLLEEYQLPAFYKDASYHVSFLWCLGDQRKELEKLLPPLMQSFSDFLTNNPGKDQVHVNELKCRIGNKLFNFNLN